MLAQECLISDAERDPDTQVRNLVKMATDASDVAMSRRNAQEPPTKAYWWSEGLEFLRQRCKRIHRKIKYAKKRALSSLELMVRVNEYKEARKDLRIAFRKAKNAAWARLLGAIDSDPWGKPYGTVLAMLGKKQHTCMENIPSEDIQEAVRTLFPAEGPDGHTDNYDWEWAPQLDISQEEIQNILKKTKRGKTPGADGVSAMVWALVASVIPERLRGAINACLRAGRFPTVLKKARLVLVPKKVGLIEERTAYRLCTLYAG